MPAKVTTQANDYREIDRFDGGVGWIAHPEEIMERASHAVATDAGVYLIDPVDAPGVDDLVAQVGAVAGVVLLSNHHSRDGPTLARRHDVPVYLPARMDAIDAGDVPTEQVGGRLPDTNYELLTLSVSSTWQEFALYDGETLIVPDSLGTADYIRVGKERLGVMLLQRLTPPRVPLSGLDPDRILVGHGEGVFEDAAGALEEAITTSRYRFPRALLENGVRQVRTVAAALRT